MNCLRTLLFIALLSILGCSSPERTPSPVVSDALLEDFVDLRFSGFWKSQKFAGEFTDLCFEKVEKDGQWTTKNGKYVCVLSGTGKLWSPTGDRPFTISGQSIGRELKVSLKLVDETISGSGTIEGQSLWETKCKMVFNYQKMQHTAWLNIMDDARLAKSQFLESNLE